MTKKQSLFLNHTKPYLDILLLGLLFFFLSVLFLCLAHAKFRVRKHKVMLG